MLVSWCSANWIWADWSIRNDWGRSSCVSDVFPLFSNIWLMFRSDNNFINICDGQTLTNGKQIVTGSCNGIPLVSISYPNIISWVGFHSCKGEHAIVSHYFPRTQSRYRSEHHIPDCSHCDRHATRKFHQRSIDLLQRTYRPQQCRSNHRSHPRHCSSTISSYFISNMFRISVVHSPLVNPSIRLDLPSSWESTPLQTAMGKFLPTFQTVYRLVSTGFALWLATPTTLLYKCLSLNEELRTIATTFLSVKDPVILTLGIMSLLTMSLWLMLHRRLHPLHRPPPLLTLSLRLTLHRQLHPLHRLPPLLPKPLEDVVVRKVARGDFKLNEGH